jgi:hypothetical protein
MSMNSKHFHTPVSGRIVCPVCKKAVYSHAGIHPQCAMTLADPPRAKRGSVPVVQDIAPVIDGTA